MKESGGLFRLAWIIPVMAVFTLTIAMWAWLDRHQPWDEALYRSVAIFDIDGNAYPPEVALSDWRFRVGRWTGAGVVFSSLLALAALLHEHLATALARYTKQAVVVIGGDPLALSGFETAGRRRHSALWLGRLGLRLHQLSQHRTGLAPQRPHPPPARPRWPPPPPAGGRP